MFLNGTTTTPATGITNTTLQFVAPPAAGTYEIRWFVNGGWTRLATSSTITVLAPPPASVTVSPSTVSAGGTLTVTVANGPGNPMDRVEVGRVNAADRGYDRCM